MHGKAAFAEDSGKCCPKCGRADAYFDSTNEPCNKNGMMVRASEEIS
jgi:hypothetical protein